ncbi:SDR family NAD(P)-dependent oxidoreductase [Neoroseomonas lacus]|uniref:3-oxoacyl-ACP reductase n=1 Tax=Neoroseomonas lacus TaxID=287609 RepID=A0A917NG03_9PROT|nr:SDR family NAD(P)-dependent oxidoreductase [Neoroseomonas lacus]GGI98498.1 3-oxoacyl-ACP reductase [Neoroseomonas lacus]
MHNPMDLTGRTIIVTGTGQGIGRAISQLVLDLGGNLVMVERNPETFADVSKALGGNHTLAIQGDVTDEVFCARVVDDAVAHFGAVHGLVNNAGITRPAMIEKMTVPQWQAVIDVNLTAVHLMQQAVGRHMISRARAGDTVAGAIVNISSTAGKRGSIGQVNYAAAKAGVLGITMTGALEWARYGIRVNSVGFGTVETPMTETVRSDRFRERTLARIPLGRIATPAEVAPLICFLLSDASSFVTGQNWLEDGGSITHV